MASYIAKVNPNLESLLIPCQTPFSANKASPNSCVQCYAILFGEGQYKSISSILRLRSNLLQPISSDICHAKKCSKQYGGGA